MAVVGLGQPTECDSKWKSYQDARKTAISVDEKLIFTLTGNESQNKKAQNVLKSRHVGSR